LGPNPRRSLTNLGGNPALSFPGDDELGQELNLTVKYFPNPKVFVQGHVAWTQPGEAVSQALGNRA
jgi:Tfp pilus assembly protein PilZ